MTTTKPNILVVDDEEGLRQILRFVLERQGYNVLEAVNGKLALDAMKNSAIHLIISDVKMPVMGGVELLDETKKVSKAPFILMTGFTDLFESQMAYKLGADAFLPKPFQTSEVKTTVAKLLKDAKVDEAEDLSFQDDLEEVNIDILAHFEKCPSDLYIKIGEVFVRVLFKGALLDKPQLAHYQQKGLTGLYMNKDDLAFMYQR